MKGKSPKQDSTYMLTYTILSYFIFLKLNLALHYFIKELCSHHQKFSCIDLIL